MIEKNKGSLLIDSLAILLLGNSRQLLLHQPTSRLTTQRVTYISASGTPQSNLISLVSVSILHLTLGFKGDSPLNKIGNP